MAYGEDLRSATKGQRSDPKVLASLMVSEREDDAMGDGTSNSTMLFKEAREIFDRYQTAIARLKPCKPSSYAHVSQVRQSDCLECV